MASQHHQRRLVRRHIGPFQHFAIARVRAVEEGLPLLRDANNGITGAIDPYGRVLSRLDLDAIGYSIRRYPRPLASTLYSRIGDLGFLVLLLIETLLVFFSRTAANKR